jgi:hypothetical protein
VSCLRQNLAGVFGYAIRYLGVSCKDATPY